MHKPPGRKNWQEAKDYCESRGERLPIILNSAQNDHIRFFMATNDLTNNQIWLGATDSEFEGTWIWVEGSLTTGEGWKYLQGGGAYVPHRDWPRLGQVPPESDCQVL